MKLKSERNFGNQSIKNQNIFILKLLCLEGGDTND
jgi:hypothetical protein